LIGWAHRIDETLERRNGSIPDMVQRHRRQFACPGLVALQTALELPILIHRHSAGAAWAIFNVPANFTAFSHTRWGRASGPFSISGGKEVGESSLYRPSQL